VTSPANDRLAIWELPVPARCVLLDHNPGLELQLHVGKTIVRSHRCVDPAMAHALAAQWWAEFATERRSHARLLVSQA